MQRPQVQLSYQLEKRLLAYAAAATATGFGLAAPASEAKIVYTPVHVTVPGNYPFPIDLDHNGEVDYIFLAQSYRTYDAITLVRPLSVCHNVVHHSFSKFVGYQCSSYRNAPNAQNKVIVAATQHGSAAALRAGKPIQHGDLFGGTSKGFPHGVRMAEVASVANTTPGTFWLGPWADDGKGVYDRYLGMKFKIKGKFHYGWARLTVRTYTKSFTTTLTGYAYETVPGKGIVAGQTQDDETPAGDLGSLALGSR
jgi:hypothetical protein